MKFENFQVFDITLPIASSARSKNNIMPKSKNNTPTPVNKTPISTNKVNRNVENQNNTHTHFDCHPTWFFVRLNVALKVQEWVKSEAKKHVEKDRPKVCNSM
jgi:hypothetical protein